MNIQSFIDYLNKSNIHLSDIQLNQFETYYNLLVEWNEKVNLTAITNKEEVYEKHFYDSITPCFYYDFSKINTICDIGAGAGFPSIPLLIANPHLKVTIVDSLKKRINFLELLTKELKINNNVTLIHSRAEDIGRDKTYREHFDVVTARAVARTNVLSEYCLPLVKINGHFIALKGQYLKDEKEEAEKAIKTLGGLFKNQHQFYLPNDGGERNIVIIEKTKKTPKAYPRKAGTPSKKPIK